MHKILQSAKEELKQIEQKGLSSSNLDMVHKLTDITKNIYKIQKLEEGEESMRGGYNDYGTGGYGRDYAYNDGGNYGRRGVPGSGRGRGGRYRGEDEKMYDHLNRIHEGVEMYHYGRDRYRDGDDESRMEEGLEKLMYGVCMFVETAMDFAETPQEKEIIRKHIQKMKNM
jgi:hypothetical protein